MDLGLSLALGAVLKSLAHHASPDGSDARPGIERISWESGLAPRAVQNNLKQLETQGYIRKVSSGVGGRRQRTDYQLLMAENPAPDAPFTKHKPRISRQQTPHLTTLNPASHDITIRKNSQGTVIEQSYTAELPKKVVTKKRGRTDVETIGLVHRYFQRPKELDRCLSEGVCRTYGEILRR